MYKGFFHLMSQVPLGFGLLLKTGSCDLQGSGCPPVLSPSPLQKQLGSAGTLNPKPSNLEPRAAPPPPPPPPQKPKRREGERERDPPPPHNPKHLDRSSGRLSDPQKNLPFLSEPGPKRLTLSKLATQAPKSLRLAPQAATLRGLLRGLGHGGSAWDRSGCTWSLGNLFKDPLRE